MTGRPRVVLRVELLEGRLVPAGVGPVEPAQAVAAVASVTPDGGAGAVIITTDAGGNEVYTFSAAPVQAKCQCPLCTGRSFQSVFREATAPTATATPAATPAPAAVDQPPTATAADRAGAPDVITTPPAAVVALPPVAGAPIAPPSEQPAESDRHPGFDVTREVGPDAISLVAEEAETPELATTGHGDDGGDGSDGFDSLPVG